MTLRQSRLFICMGALLVLGAVNSAIWQKQQVLADGQIILLKLAPVDPRSLMQGDYMILRYDLADQLEQAEQRGLTRPTEQPRGQLLLEFDAAQVVHTAQPYQGQRLQPQQHLLNYRNKNGQIWFGAESFFFQEGQAETYQNAEYAELRVDAHGQSILVGLRDVERRPIRPPAKAQTNAL